MVVFLRGSSWALPLEAAQLQDPCYLGDSSLQLGAPMVTQTVKNPQLFSREAQVQFLGRGDPWRREWQPTLAFLPGKSQEPRGAREATVRVPRVRHN